MFGLSFRNYSGPVWGEGFADEPAVTRQPKAPVKVQPKARPAPGDRLEAFIKLMDSLHYAEGHAEMRECARRLEELNRKSDALDEEIDKVLQEESQKSGVK